MTAPTPAEAVAWAQHMVAADRWYLGRDHLAVLLAERDALRAELEQARTANDALREENRQPFCGSLAVLLAKPASVMETANDLDGDLVTFWRVLRDQPDEMERVCALTPHSRAEHADSYDRPADLPDVERARRVWVQLTQGRGGVGVRSGWRHYVAPAGGTGMPAYLRGYLARFGPAVERLARVSLECRPAEEVIDRYGQEPDVLLYVDPPYLGAARANGVDNRGGTQRYRVEMLDEPAHAALLDQLSGCRAAVVLSGYRSRLYDDALGGWDRVEIVTGTGQSAQGERSQRTEVLWSNREISTPHLFSELLAGAAAPQPPETTS